MSGPACATNHTGELFRKIIRKCNKNQSKIQICCPKDICDRENPKAFFVGLAIFDHGAGTGCTRHPGKATEMLLFWHFGMTRQTD